MDLRSSRQFAPGTSKRILVTRILAASLVSATCILPAAIAQESGAAEWTTGSYNPQRDAWQRNETKLTRDNVKDLQLLWKVKVDNKTMGMQSFREPLLVSGVQTAGGAKDLAIVAGSYNDIFVLDAATGDVVWKKQLKWASDKPEEPGEGRGFICTNALSATPVVSPAGSGDRSVYLLTTDGFLHTLSVASGEEKDAPIQVLSAPYGKPYGLNLVNNVIYTITGQGCGGVPNALYAIDLTTKKVTMSSPPQAGLWGVAGPAIGTDGTVYFESGDGPYDAKAGTLPTSVLAFNYTSGTLALKDYYSPSNYIWLTKRDLDMNATPVIFPYQGRDFLVASGKEGRFFLLDSKSIGGSNHETPVFRSELITNTNANFQTEGTWGSHAAWKAADGTQWVLAPSGSQANVKFPVTNGLTPHGGILAFKLDDKGGSPKLVPAWTSPDMLTAEPPVIANGVVYVLAGGEFTGQANDEEGGLYSSEQRIARSKPAKLYALDALTGKQLFSSGDQIASFLHQAGLSVANGRVVFGTFDGTIYCFGRK
jgi:outer membrane protein assembly factor BamB